jgi:hypothetical protein
MPTVAEGLICFYVKSNVRTSFQQAHLPQPFHRTLSKSLLSQEMTTKPNTLVAIHCRFSLVAPHREYEISQGSPVQISLTAK